MKRLLVQTQLSNYTKDGLFVLECDSGWQMCMNRVRELLRLVPNLHVDVTGPKHNQLVTVPEGINPEFLLPSVRYVQHYVPPNALLSRHHFDVREMIEVLRREYDAAYINDPMQFRNYKALLRSNCKLYAVHNHFVDVPSCPKFPEDVSLWHGQCEAVSRGDINFFQCAPALDEFERAYGKAPNAYVWDDGYSVSEVLTPVNPRRIRFDPALLKRRPVVFVPNRVGGRGVSSDYTNCGKFLFELLSKQRNFNVVAGNPSQKFSNQQLTVECGALPLTIDAFTRDEYKLVATNTSVVVALYDKDTYGGTAVRECIELGALPLWLNCNEYAAISREAEYPFLVNMDFSNTVEVLETLLALPLDARNEYSEKLRTVVRAKCSTEVTTRAAAERMGLL
jgi:hypothetical protein